MTLGEWICVCVHVFVLLSVCEGLICMGIVHACVDMHVSVLGLVCARLCRMYTHLSLHAYIWLYTQVSMQGYVCEAVLDSAGVGTHISMSACTAQETHMLLCVSVCLCVCSGVCFWASMSICTSVWNACMCVYVYMLLHEPAQASVPVFVSLCGCASMYISISAHTPVYLHGHVTVSAPLAHLSEPLCECSCVCLCLDLCRS